ncbi:aminopeptidase N [Thiolapillus brandeum]|uniref:Aminopeptidase N n=1 Tax=Thiolapillus brandeum TaxID=1076588 RepID=A0A7U6GI79_9GAMM|nr:aminopeptidase N [Thiolapillus brandeum]BAO44119.1 aminopeptidase N [Thiolapillus brandeum]
MGEKRRNHIHGHVRCPVVLGFLLLLCWFNPASADTPNLTWEEAMARSRLVSSVDYQLYFEFGAGSGEYLGRVEVAFDLASRPESLFLDFQGDHLKKLRVNDREIPDAAIRNYRVYLAPELLRVGRNRVTLEYENAFDTNGSGLSRFVDPADGNAYFFSHFEPFHANRLFPCFDQPDLKASYALTVVAPKGWRILSNTLADTTVSGSRARHVFNRSKRFSTYLFALAGGPFAVFEDQRARVPSRVFTTRSMAAYADVEQIFEVTRQGMDFYEDYFGIPYPFGKYDQIFVPHFNEGAMENVAAVIINEDSYLYREKPRPSQLKRRANTLLHEMAHMWFGDIVTMRWWNDLWLNESFATYMSYLAQVRATGDKDAWQGFSSRMKAWAYWQDQLPTTHPIETRVPDTSSTFDNFDGITYGKGAAVLKQLAFFVGPENFRKGVAAYLKGHAWKNAARRDFTHALEKSSGRNLEDWTRLWLQTSGINTLEVDYRLDSKGRISHFEVLQGKGNGDAVLRPHRLQIAFYTAGIKVRTVNVEIRGARTRVKALEGLAAPDFIFPNQGDHAYAKCYLDQRSLDWARARAHLERLPGDIRVAIWNTLWFMVRDGRLPPAAYMEIFLDKVARETDASLVEAFRWKLDTLLNQYMSQEEWRTSVRHLYDLAWQQLKSLPPGSDLQAAWLEHFLRGAESAEAARRLQGMLEGRVVVPGLELGQDRRWRILIRLAALGVEDIEALLSRESLRDPGERGRKQLFVARAALPDPASKARIWKRLLEDRKLPLTYVRAALEVFYQRSHPELTHPWAERYFQVLPGVVKNRSPRFARSFIRFAFPRMNVEPSVLDETDRLLQEDIGKTGFLHRLLLEARDSLARALRIRHS